MNATSKFWRPHPTADSPLLRMRGRFLEIKPTCRPFIRVKVTNILVLLYNDGFVKSQSTSECEGRDRALFLVPWREILLWRW